MTDRRVCLGCGRRLVLSNFYKNSGGKYGRRATCIKCCKAAAAQKRTTPILDAVETAIQEVETAMQDVIAPLPEPTQPSCWRRFVANIFGIKACECSTKQ